MAKQVQAVVESITGKLMLAEEVRRAIISVEGVGTWELAVSPESWKQVEKALAPFLAKEEMQPWQEGKQPESRSRKAPEFPVGYLAKVRAWAAEQGIEVAPKGIVRKEVREAYDGAVAAGEVKPTE